MQDVRTRFKSLRQASRRAVTLETGTAAAPRQTTQELRFKYWLPLHSPVMKKALRVAEVLLLQWDVQDGGHACSLATRIVQRLRSGSCTELWTTCGNLNEHKSFKINPTGWVSSKFRLRCVTVHWCCDGVNRTAVVLQGFWLNWEECCCFFVCFFLNYCFHFVPRQAGGRLSAAFPGHVWDVWLEVRLSFCLLRCRQTL